MEKKQILVVEDESITALDIQRTLQDMGYDVPCTVASGEEAIQKAHENKPDLVLMDVVLAGQMNGIEAAEQICSRLKIPVLYVSASVNKEMLEKNGKNEPLDLIAKPFDEKQLKDAIESAIKENKHNKQVNHSLSL